AVLPALDHHQWLLALTGRAGLHTVLVGVACENNIDVGGVIIVGRGSGVRQGDDDINIIGDAGCLSVDGLDVIGEGDPWDTCRGHQGGGLLGDSTDITDLDVTEVHDLAAGRCGVTTDDVGTQVGELCLAGAINRNPLGEVLVSCIKLMVTQCGGIHTDGVEHVQGGGVLQDRRHEGGTTDVVTDSDKVGQGVICTLGLDIAGDPCGAGLTTGGLEVAMEVGDAEDVQLDGVALKRVGGNGERTQSESGGSADSKCRTGKPLHLFKFSCGEAGVL